MPPTMIPLTDSAKRHRLSQTAVNLGLLSNIILAGAKTAAGIVGMSPALVSDGINSISDTVYYLVVKFFIRYAALPPDREHPYGHTQLETIASLVVGAFVLTTAVAIFWNQLGSVVAVISGQKSLEVARPVALWVALATVAIKSALTVFTRRRAGLSRSPAVEALAIDHRNDLFASAGVAIGIILSRAGLLWVDPLAGALVAVMIFQTGIVILRNSAFELMDAVPSGTLANEITTHLSGVTEIVQVEEIHAHRFGPYFMVNITIGLDGNRTIAEGDAVCGKVEETLYREMPWVRKVYVHSHPAVPGANQVGTIPKQPDGP